MNPRIILVLAIAAFLPAAASAAGLPPWELGMSKARVASVKERGPYKSFSNGDLETNNGVFRGRKANVQFYFSGDRLRRISVHLYEGTAPKGGIPAWRSAYQALEQAYGKISMPDIHVAAKSDPVNADVLAIAAAAHADVVGRTSMLPVKQPPGMRVSGQFRTAMVNGRKWYYVVVDYDPEA